ncbi:hypothetical protein GWK47_011712 [Chionoecetes opilio]|uniref:Uncharacterized protein n=1 Tax=Chionoecetes opilio TaxID=41210 RepID=A0A8J4XVC4_CHIOP|nr:hypothetical protein GWK47_011712 [Chionoecetes opilio]
MMRSATLSKGSGEGSSLTREKNWCGKHLQVCAKPLHGAPLPRRSCWLRVVRHSSTSRITWRLAFRARQRGGRAWLPSGPPAPGIWINGLFPELKANDLLPQGGRVGHVEVRPGRGRKKVLVSAGGGVSSGCCHSSSSRGPRAHGQALPSRARRSSREVHKKVADCPIRWSVYHPEDS